MEKVYNHKLYESKLYAQWEQSGFFNPDTAIKDATPFSIMMPPPNVTGVLHLGHAFENSLMDAEARYQRMRGKKVLFLPGTDHAAVATQARVENELIKSKKYKHPRKELGREGLLNEIRAYAEKSKSTILAQLRTLGISCDWSRLAYTFDEQRSTAVNAMFKRMYDDGLIYRGYRVVNWSVKGQSTCSDDEIVHQEREAILYTFSYSKDFPIPIASSRPETKLGDTAVAIHPDDKRYKKFIGKTFIVNFVGQPLKIKIIADASVDPKFGTGALGVTPAHSQIDYEMYEKNPEIGIIPVIDQFGRMTANAGKTFEGLRATDARAKIVEQLKADGLLVKEEKIQQSAGTSDRFGDVVEVIPMEQWFVAVNKEIPSSLGSQRPGKTLKDLMREAVTIGHNGDKTQKIQIVPKRFEKNYLNWIDHLRDWCISRQIWWGHRIPVWYRTNKDSLVTERIMSIEQPRGDGWTQDPDTLDTWFSSGMWTFSTLGWPQQTADLATFHPTSWMTMGYEILFFWMARMILMSTYALDQIPFRVAYIHGMLRDEQGRKFSKSLGNGIDPVEIIEQYGADALRFALVYGAAPGTDQAWTLAHLKGGRNFANKLWNMARFLQMNGAKFDAAATTDTALATVIDETTANFEKHHFAEALRTLHNYTWHELADKEFEAAKTDWNDETAARLAQKFTTLLIMIHPFMPFVTEAIWQELGLKQHDTDFLMIQQWPKR